LIPFLLLYKKTRGVAFFFVVFFHVFTRVLFPIGMFPFVMIVSALIFFDSGLHQKIIDYIKKIGSNFSKLKKIETHNTYQIKNKSIIIPMLGVFFVLQLIIPFRNVLYPNELFWTEEGFRFSWRVMLMEKMGYANFKIVDGETKDYFYVDNTDFLTPLQEKQMSFQPDFILEYAHYLGDHFKKQGHKNVEVYVKSFVALNGRLSQPFINEDVNLYAEKESFKPKHWILPFNDEIKGL
ncbi:HTTM domain-containing protein, partial [Pontimicrobium sp. MEBiC01747]